MVVYWKIVNDVIERSDILLLVLDARMPQFTRNIEIEKKVSYKGKKILYVINKCDLIDIELSKKIKKTLSPSVFVSGKKHFGTNLLREQIMRLSKGENCIVGVLGYPNVGKSSVINMLKGKTSASVSPTSGHTKAVQKIRASGKIVLLDTPGVIPFMEKDIIKQTLIGTINFDKVKDPELIVLGMIENLDGRIEDYYGIEKNEDPEIVLENLAKQRNKILKGNIPDTFTMSRIILKDWQQGKIK